MAITNVIFLGPPGSGKGTQADLLAERVGLLHLSSGNLFREAIREGTSLGKLAQSYMDRGEYVPDDVTVRMVMQRVSWPDAAGGVIFDGFPRTREQALALNRSLAELGRAILGVVVFRVRDDEIIKRLSARRVCPKDGSTYNLISKPPLNNEFCDLDGETLVQRDDDRPETIRHRLDLYYQQTAPLIDFYRELGLVREIDGLQPVDRVQASISQVLEKLPDPAAPSKAAGKN